MGWIFQPIFFMRTLLITNTYDQTSDLLVLKMGSENFIRINFDRPQDWLIEFSPNDLKISSLHGEFTNSEISKCFWRKPFISEPKDGIFKDKFYVSEWKYLIYELSSFMEEQGKLRFNPPSPDYMLGKMKQQRKAKNYFKIPKSNWSINVIPDTKNPCITKSMSASTFNDNSVLYTTEVSNKELSSDIWYLQELINAEYDLTIVHIYGLNFAFQLNRDNLTGIDWRKDQVDHVQHWIPYNLSPEFNFKINSFMNEMDLVYGRLDFMNDSSFEEPYFLEVNKNGQWAWLDPNFDNGLFIEMCKVIDPHKA